MNTAWFLDRLHYLQYPFTVTLTEWQPVKGKCYKANGWMKSLLCIKYKMIYTLKVEMNSSPHPPKEVSTMHTLFI